jgi:hypothetical protein
MTREEKYAHTRTLLPLPRTHLGMGCVILYIIIMLITRAQQEPSTIVAIIRDVRQYKIILL